MFCLPIYIIFSAAKENLFKVKELIKMHYLSAVLTSEFEGTIHYEIPNSNLKLSELFNLMNSKAKELEIVDWGVSQSTLEDVFMSIVHNAAVDE